jgi:hypothetical protein
MSEYPGPIPPLGASRPPSEPYALHRPPRPPAVVDLDVDLFGAEPAAARLAEQLADVRDAPVRVDGDGVRLLSPAFDPGHDRVDGMPTARVMVVAFGAHASPRSRTLAASCGA